MEEKFQHQNTIYPKLDIIREKEGLDYDRKQKMFQFFLKTFLGLFILGVILISLFSYKVMSLSRNVFQGEKKSSLFSNLKKLILAEDKKIQGEKEGRTNILLLGMGGEGHEGALLTDTIIIVSIKYQQDKKNEVSLISIPRDLGIPYQGMPDFKINNLYAQALNKNNYNEKETGKEITETVSQVFKIPIHYYIRVDFEGFRKIVDSLDGIEIEVKNSFKDPKYPTEDFGYQTIYFEKGKQKMNGEQALQYSRSRHGILIDGEGDEASDFARAKRQQQVLEAIKDKAFSVSTIVNPKRIHDLLAAFGDHVRTNLEAGEMMRLFDLGRQIQKDKIQNQVIDNGDKGLLYTTTSSYGAYILLPKNNDFSEIQSFVQNIFNFEKEDQKTKIVVLNGTEIPDLAKQYADILQKENYNIVFFGNGPAKDYEKTVIYNKVKHNHPYTLKALRDRLSANIAPDIPREIKENQDLNKKDWDIVIVLGENIGE